MNYSFVSLLIVLLSCSSSLYAQIGSNQRGSVLNERLQISPGSNLNERLQQAPGFVPGTINPAQPMGQIQQILAIIKPDTVEANRIGDIIARFERSNLNVVALKMMRLTRAQAARFYAIYRERPFYSELIEFMSSGPLIAMVLEGDQAIARSRQLINTTNPAWSGRGTIRPDFAQLMNRAANFELDSPQSVQQNIRFFFSPNEIFSRF